MSEIVGTADAAVVLMTHDEARRAADDIRSGMEHIGNQLVDLYEREGWRALGYANWRECVQTEFGWGTSQAYRRLRAARVNLELSPIGETTINEAQARELARIPDRETRTEVWREAVNQRGERVTAATIRELRTEESPPYDVSDGRVIDIPDIQPIPKAAKIFEQLIRMSTVTQDAPEAVAEAAIRYHASSARNYLTRSEAVLTWHAQFVAALKKHLERPVRAIT